jgi:hypothetical protein
MAKTNLEGRKVFQPSGKVNWVRFIPWSALAFGTAGLLAALLFFLFSIGFYLVGVVPLFAALGLAAMVMLAVKRGQCRSKLVAGLLGCMTGILVYLGYYYIGMVHDVGVENAGNLGLLPKYIAFRMKFEEIKEVGAPNRDQRDNRPHSERPVFNWVFFALEFGLMVCIPCASGITWSRRPYCERCQDWTKRETTSFKPEIGPGIVEALRLGSAQSLAALFTSPQHPGAPNTAAAVDYCPKLKEQQLADCPMYLSVKQVKAAPAGIAKDPFSQSKGKMLVRQILLNSDEVPALLSRFKSLETIAGRTADQALKELRVEVKSARPTQAVAEVTPGDSAYAGRILTTKNAFIRTTFALLGLVGVFAPIGLGFLGGFLAFPDHSLAGGVSLIAKVCGEFLIGLAIIIFVANMVMLFWFPDIFGGQYIRRLALREFARRPRPMVNPTAPSARFVQIIPRANWGRLKLFDASDIGFLSVDAQRNELLFEGDKECYRIPGAAITSCEVEVFIAAQGTHGATKLYRVVLQVNRASGTFWEVPIAEYANSGKFRAKVREKWGRELQAEIRSLMSANVLA